MHEKDFELVANWVFLQPVMRNHHEMEQIEQLNMLSLKKVYKNQQINKLFHACICLISVNNSLATSRFFITTKRMNIVRGLLSNHFEKLKPVPGTRYFHHFSPIHENCIQVKRCSLQQAFIFDLSHNLSNVSNIKLI